MTIVDDIKEKIHIEDLVSEISTVNLRRSGASMVGFCPFHVNKKTPALVVWPGTQTWKCFGSCNDGGDVFEWVLRQNPGWDFKEALRYLASKASITLQSADEGGLAARVTAQAKEDALRIAHRVFVRWLVGMKERGGKVAKKGDTAAFDYAQDRGWTERTIRSAGLGFTGRATPAEFKDMRGEFQLHGVDPLSPEAVMILGFKGDVKAWAKKYEMDVRGLGENYIHGLMNTPGLVYTHKMSGKIEYFSVRFLPGFDETRKSHNPNSTLAGPRRPFFNWLHRRHHAGGNRRGKRIFIVEGQGCAVTWGQFGEASMALCGSSWNYLEETGIIQGLKDEYEEIIYVTDADAPGESVVTGKNNDFPLTTAFGSTLWVARTPAREWERPDGFKKSIGDTNDVAQWLLDTIADDKERESRRREINDSIAENAEPIALEAARYAGNLKGQLRQGALKNVVAPLITMLPNGLRVDYAAEFAGALYPDMSRTKAEGTYQKWIKGELKKAEATADSDDDDFITEECLGGWYPDDETNNSGYLIDIFYDNRMKKVRFAYAHITDMKNNQRQIVEAADFVIIGIKKIIPVRRPDVLEFLDSGALKMPSKVGALLSSSDLMKKMASFYQKFFYMDDKSSFAFMAAYSLFTWVHDCFDLLTFLRARGGSGSGKSDLMYLIGITSYRFAAISASSTDASYRGLAKDYKATIMIDEVQEAIRKDDGSLASYLKARFSKRISNHTKMTEVTDENGRKIFAVSVTDVYGPTLLTMYGSFKDGGIENRCMSFDLSQVDMMTLDKHNIEPGYYPPEIEGEAEEIRNEGLRWRLGSWKPKLELSKEQRTEIKLSDQYVSPRINSTLRPMKVLAVLQDDMELLEDLKKVGRANYKDEMVKRSSSFEAVVLRALLAADIAQDVKEGLQPIASVEYAKKVEVYSEHVSRGNLGELGSVRYILYKHVALIANEIMDSENTDAEDDKKKSGIKGKTIGSISRESYRLPVVRTSSGFVVILEREKLELGKLRFGLDREAEYQLEEMEAVPVQDGPFFFD